MGRQRPVNKTKQGSFSREAPFQPWGEAVSSSSSTIPEAPRFGSSTQEDTLCPGHGTSGSLGKRVVGGPQEAGQAGGGSCSLSPKSGFPVAPTPSLPEGPPYLSPSSAESLCLEQSKKPVPETFLSGGGGRGRGCDFLEPPSPTARAPPSLGPAGACCPPPPIALGEGPGKGQRAGREGSTPLGPLRLPGKELSGETLISKMELSGVLCKWKGLSALKRAWWAQLAPNRPSSSCTALNCC